MSRRGTPFVARPQTLIDPVLNHPRGVVLRAGAFDLSTRSLAAYLADARDLEETAFRAWLEAIYARYDREHLNHFEHNVDVWMQLWHTVHTSDVLCLVADARNPLWHIPLSLYEEVTRDLHKPLVVVLNKADLVPQGHVDAWLRYLRAAFPGVTAFVPFSGSAAIIPPGANLPSRRRAIRDARASFDAEHVGRRADGVRRLLQAVGATPADVEEVVSRVQATQKARTAASREDKLGPLLGPAELAAMQRRLEEEEEGEEDEEDDEEEEEDNSEHDDDDDDDAGAHSDSEGAELLPADDNVEEEGLIEEGDVEGSDGDSDASSDDAAGPGRVANARGHGASRGRVSFAALAMDDDDGSDSGSGGDVGGEASGVGAPASGRHAGKPGGGSGGAPTHGKAGGSGRQQPQPRRLRAGDNDSDEEAGPSDKAVRRAARKAKKAGRWGLRPDEDASGGGKAAKAAPAPKKGSALAPSAGTGDSAAPSSSSSASGAGIAAPRPHVFTVGMIGHPNVGKSSVINTLCSEKRVSVSRTAGHTKRAQTIPLVPGSLHLLDCPGLVFPHALVPPPADLLAAAGITPAQAAAWFGDSEEERGMQEVCGVVPLAQVREPYTGVRVLAERLPLERLYGLTLPKDEDGWSPLTLCEALAVKRGFMIAKVGRPDAHAAGREILYDTGDGIVPVAWDPPALPAAAGSTA